MLNSVKIVISFCIDLQKLFGFFIDAVKSISAPSDSKEIQKILLSSNSDLKAIPEGTNFTKIRKTKKHSAHKETYYSERCYCILKLGVECFGF